MFVTFKHASAARALENLGQLKFDHKVIKFKRALNPDDIKFENFGIDPAKRKCSFCIANLLAGLIIMGMAALGVFSVKRLMI